MNVDSSKLCESSNSCNDDICRDYLRNVCRRGSKCKFRHLNGIDNEAGKMDGREVQFCHDFQNIGICRRSSCRFLHCSREEEEKFKITGKLPAHINSPPGSPPICKDYLKGECHRASRCKFRHLTVNEYESEINKNQSLIALDFLEDDLQAAKRRRLEVDAEWRASLEEENMLLRRRVSELKKQVSDLTAVNDLLLDQNARYRTAQAGLANTMKAQPPTVQTCIQTVVSPTRALAPPVVSVSQVLTPTVTPAPAILRAAAAQPTLVQTAPPAAPPPLSHATVLPPRPPLEAPPPAIAGPPGPSISTSLSTPLLSYPIMSHSVVPNSNLG
ncbi:unnamed protein product [Dimorphilus gyrociliatus]|uniref:C3H1-type domain-containing protein n=1 Tax=Dimorphilus gyrociliatus TaxID=2664684 RepID=A0A7I8V4G3_9ANNE|nr:unnamed protein product [Dimorphilus gyrociliatus]